MNLNKLCPVCRMEYLYHIDKCADCGHDLVLPEEYNKTQTEIKRIAGSAIENRVVVRKGDLGWLSELRAVLMEASIPSTIVSEDNCSKGCCSDSFHLMVGPGDLERAQESIEEYFMVINPELCDANELIKAGKCPACSFPAPAEARECPDCGLPLLIIEDE